MLEQFSCVWSPHRLGSAAIGDGRARSRQHDQRRGEIKGGGRGVHSLDLATFTPDVSGDVLNLIFRGVSRSGDK